MKQRLIFLATTLVFLVSLGLGYLPGHVNAAGSPPTSFKYTDKSWSTITAQVGGGTQTYHQESGSTTGDYNGGAAVGYSGCTAIIQPNDNKYDGDGNAQWWASCDSGVQDKTSINISGGSSGITINPINAAQQQVYDIEICPTLQGIDPDFYAKTCLAAGDPNTQSGLDKVVNTICNKYPTQLQAQCADYQNKTYNPNNAPSSTSSCESSGGGYDLNWILCSAFEGVQNVVNWMFTAVISPLLSVRPICLPGNACGKETIYKVWSNFRIYGDIFLVIVLLVIVFGESIGGGMIDAYTAKKVLPRLLAAAILINLSIYIMAFAIDLTNIVGQGIGQLLTSPLPKDGNNFTISPGNVTAGAIFGTAAGTGLIAGAFAVSVTGIALLLLGLAITGAIAVLGVFFTLIIRQSIILGLVLVSPVAFALWCLPNTEQWFKRWWDTFFQMLLVYPMVVVLFAVADIMSYLTANNGSGGSYANNIIAFMLLLIPLYLIPFTLRSSNRLMGAIQGAASNVGRQINAATGRRALGAASQNTSEKLRATGNYSGLSDRNRLFRGINTIGGTVANPRSLLHGRAGVRASRQAKRTTHGAEVLKDSAIFQANQGDDKFLLAVANRGLAEQKLAATQQKFEEARSKGDMDGMTSAQSTMDAQQHALDAAAQLGAAGRSTGVRHQALQALSRTGFQFAPTAEGYAELSDTARQLSGGDERAYSAIMNESQYNLRSAGRFDLGGINDGAGYDPGAGVSKASLYELANAKAESIQGMMDSTDTNATQPTHEHAVVYKELQAMKPNAKGAVRDEIDRQIDNLEEFGIKDFLRQPTGATRTGVDPRTGQQVSIPETNDDVAERAARTYERPDPNRLGGESTTPNPGNPTS